jgi:hypothetical protein
MSGARDDRPGLAALMEYVRTGDTVVVWKLDRLGRNLWHILQTVKELTECGVTLVSVTDGIDSSTAAGRMMIGVLGSLAEYERELTKERTALKRVTSRANGTKFGRPRKVYDIEHITTAKRMKADGHTGKDIAKYLGVSRAALPSAPRLILKGPLPTLVEMPRWLTVNRNGPAFFDLRSLNHDSTCLRRSQERSLRASNRHGVRAEQPHRQSQAPRRDPSR